MNLWKYYGCAAVCTLRCGAYFIPLSRAQAKPSHRTAFAAAAITSASTASAAVSFVCFLFVNMNVLPDILYHQLNLTSAFMFRVYAWRYQSKIANNIFRFSFRLVRRFILLYLFIFLLLSCSSFGRFVWNRHYHLLNIILYFHINTHRIAHTLEMEYAHSIVQLERMRACGETDGVSGGSYISTLYPFSGNGIFTFAR